MRKDNVSAYIINSGTTLKYSGPISVVLRVRNKLIFIHKLISFVDVGRVNHVPYLWNWFAELSM